MQALAAYDAGAVLPPLAHVVETTAEGPALTHRRLSDQRLRAFLRRDTWVHRHPALRGRIAAANELAPLALSDAEIVDLLAFLECLTDPASTDLTALIPDAVPSGLPVDD